MGTTVAQNEFWAARRTRTPLLRRGCACVRPRSAATSRSSAMLESRSSSTSDLRPPPSIGAPCPDSAPCSAPGCSASSGTLPQALLRPYRHGHGGLQARLPGLGDRDVPARQLPEGHLDPTDRSRPRHLAQVCVASGPPYPRDLRGCDPPEVPWPVEADETYIGALDHNKRLGQNWRDGKLPAPGSASARRVVSPRRSSRKPTSVTPPRSSSAGRRGVRASTRTRRSSTVPPRASTRPSATAAASTCATTSGRMGSRASELCSTRVQGPG